MRSCTPRTMLTMLWFMVGLAFVVAPIIRFTEHDIGTGLLVSLSRDGVLGLLGSRCGHHGVLCCHPRILSGARNSRGILHPGGDYTDVVWLSHDSGRGTDPKGFVQSSLACGLLLGLHRAHFFLTAAPPLASKFGAVT